MTLDDYLRSRAGQPSISIDPDALRMELDAFDELMRDWIGAGTPGYELVMPPNDKRTPYGNRIDKVIVRPKSN